MRHACLDRRCLCQPRRLLVYPDGSDCGGHAYSGSCDTCADTSACASSHADARTNRARAESAVE
jgi:hypothetical protein